MVIIKLNWKRAEMTYYGDLSAEKQLKNSCFDIPIDIFKWYNYFDLKKSLYMLK